MNEENKPQAWEEEFKTRFGHLIWKYENLIIDFIKEVRQKDKERLMKKFEEHTLTVEGRNMNVDMVTLRDLYSILTEIYE